MTALCTPQDGLDYLANLRLSDNESGLSTTSLGIDAEAITTKLKHIFVNRGYMERDENPSTVLNSTALILAKRLAASRLGQEIMNNRTEVIDPRLLGIQRAQKNFTDYAWTQLEHGKYDPIFFPDSYKELFDDGDVVPTDPPTYSATPYSTVTLVKYLSPGWTPDSKNQVTTSVCEDWIEQITIEIYALALTRGTFDLVALTQDQARDLGNIINIGVAGLVLQANSFAASKQQVSVEAMEKMKKYIELRRQLMIGYFDGL
jgi:hypothetical protein